MKILFLSRWFPYPINNGSKVRIFTLLRGLAKHHDITLLSFADQPDVRPDAPELRSICSEINVVPWQEYNPRGRRARLGFLSASPRFILDTYSSPMAEMIRRTILKTKYDLVIASQLSMASYYRCFSETPALFEELELGLFSIQAVGAGSRFKSFRSNLTWYKLSRYVSSILNHYQACTVASEQELTLFKNNFPAFKRDVEVIPNCVSLEDYENIKAVPVSNQLIFTGSFRYQVNYDAMVWFVREVFPKVLKHLPGTKLVITGDHANLPLPSLINVTLTGYVEDIKSLIASSAVSIAPLWSGGGTRLKILEAMAIGTPVVATSKGAEGLDLQHDANILIADSPEDFANCVIRLLKDNDLRENLAKNAKSFVKEKYDWASVMPRYLQLIERISSG
jgi:polysaccharide biosynthesis protein PslH